MSEANALVCAYQLDAAGGGTALDWSALQAAAPLGGTTWVHLDRLQPGVAEWLSGPAGLDPVIVEAMLELETRPRCEPFGDGALIILRGVNLNPGADPEDMISIRIWVQEDRLISTRSFRLMAVQDVRERLETGRGPKDIGELLVAIAGGLIQRMGPVIDSLEEAADDLEEEVILKGRRDIRPKLIQLRQQTIALRRYLSPQREALNRILAEDWPWFRERHRLRLREVADRTVRYIEDLDQVRERASIVQDELMNRLSEQMNRTMYVLTLVAAIMLPLGFLTGLLGINVGGIPGAENPLGFIFVCLALAVLMLIQILVFRRLRWI
jgi:zinc transporter